MIFDKHYVSVKFRWLAFLAMLSIVFLHAGGYSTIFINGPLYISRWGVTWFAFASGIFFAVQLKRYSLIEFCQRRFHSLVVPYLVWTLFGLLVWLLLSQMVNVRIDLSWEGVGNWFGFPHHAPSVNPPLWFLRSLFLFSLLLATIHKLAETFVRERNLRKLVVATVFSGAILFSVYMNMDCVFGIYTVPFFFLGGYLVSDMVVEGYPAIGHRRAIIVLSIAALFVVVMSALYGWLLGGGMINKPAEIMLRNGANILLIIILWISYDLVFGKSPSLTVNEVVNMNFFPFLAHYPIIHLGYVLVGKRIGGDVYFLVSAVFSCVGLIGLGLLLKRKFPNLFSFLTGGR